MFDFVIWLQYILSVFTIASSFLPTLNISNTQKKPNSNELSCISAKYVPQIYSIVV